MYIKAISQVLIRVQAKPRVEMNLKLRCNDGQWDGHSKKVLIDIR